jgi:ELWxxDGT repeat protein
MKKLITISLQLFIVILLNAQTPALLTEINPGGDAIGYFFQKHIVLFDGGLFFTANDGMHGYELWRTDGTEAGTQLVKDINEGAEGSDCQKLYAAGDLLFFLATDEEHGYELWRSDGTEAGTQLVKDIIAGPQSGIYIDGGLANDHFVWNGILYFAADDGAAGYELWRSDGTEAGTYMVKDITEGVGHSYPRAFAEHNGKVYFWADGALWATDGTEGGTQEISPKTYPQHTVSCNGYLLFTGPVNGFSDFELWRSDGADAGTVVVKEINPDGGGSYGCPTASQEELVVIGNVAYFAADDGTGRELWRSDGTEAGTYMVRDASVNEFANCAKSFAVLDGVLYYGFDDGAHGFEIWRSDGTEAGTYMVKDLRPGSSGSFNNVGSRHIAALGNRLIFAAGYSAPADLEPWISDGTEAGTVLLAELDPGNASSDPRDFFLLGNDVIFTAKTFGIGYELWKMPLLSGVREIPRHKEYFQLLPSITDGRFSVAFQDETHLGAFDVALAGITGAVLKTWRSVRPGEELEVYELPAGAYLVRISDGKKIVEVKKLVVVK